MSRIGKIPVKIPQGVKVAIANGLMSVEGPKGKLTQQYHESISFDISGDQITVSRANEEKQSKAYHGLYRNLLNNMVIGVSAGFSRTLIINGVGFRAEVKGELLTLNLGYSNEIMVHIPKGLSVTADASGKLTMSGIDKHQVGEFASQIRQLRLPEPYKGKGIRYDNETIRRKVGKSGVK